MKTADDGYVIETVHGVKQKVPLGQPEESGDDQTPSDGSAEDEPTESVSLLKQRHQEPGRSANPDRS